MARKEETEEKLSKWEATLKQLEKDFGKGSLMGAREKPAHLEYVSTGSLGLDLALGIGGLPRGRIIEIMGPESSGKTTMIMHLIAEGQKKNPSRKFAIIDAEHSLDLEYAEALGVNLDNLLISQPDYGEQALEIAKRLIDTGEMDVVAIDSVAALVPKSELEGEIGDASVGKQARMMSQAMRVLAGKTEKNGTILIFTNQIREKIGLMFGNPEIGSGGNALKFYASVRLDIRKVTTNKEGEEAVSNKVRVKVTKNKVSPPFRQAEFNIVYGKGIDKFAEIIDLAVETDVVSKGGSWYSYKGDKIGQGLESVIALLSDNNELYEEIRAKTIEKLFV